MSKTLIKNAKIVNEGKIFDGDLLIENGIITEIAISISPKSPDTNVLYVDGKHLFPGMIDDQVHFREPGMSAKASIYTEQMRL